jgi:hypothetical protein
MWIIRRRSRHLGATAAVNVDLDDELLAALPCALVRRLPGVPACALFAAYHLARRGASPQRLRHDLGLTGAEAGVVVDHVRGRQQQDLNPMHAPGPPA